jgi:hypothetical protein
MPAIIFSIRLTEEDWDATQRGWSCPPLRIPSATLQDIIVDGNRVDKHQYAILLGQAMIHWVNRNHPEGAAAIIELNDDLTLGSETDRWKKLAVVFPMIATILAASISGTATYFARPSTTTPSVNTSFKWIRLPERGDWSGHDRACSNGYTPKSSIPNLSLCDSDNYGRIAVCWNEYNPNPEPPKTVRDCSNTNTFCTYKEGEVSIFTPVNGKHLGAVYLCISPDAATPKS